MKVFQSRNTLPAAQHLHKINPWTIERVYIVDKSINSELGEQFLGEGFFFFTVAEVWSKAWKKKRLESRADFYSLPVGTLEAKR